jgi:hypothetical protein
VRQGSGSLQARTIARQIVELFRGLTLNGGTSRFVDSSVGNGGPGDEDGLYGRLSASVQFEADF